MVLDNPHRASLSGNASALRNLELVVIATIVIILVAITIQYATRLMARAERESMRATVNNLKSGIMLSAMHHLVRGDVARLAALANENPMRSANRRPAKDLGEVPDGEAQQLAGGSWYFDPGARLLGYRVKHEWYFSSQLPGPKSARFRVALRFVDGDHDGRLNSVNDTFTGITIEPVEPYEWRFDGEPSVQR